MVTVTTKPAIPYDQRVPDPDIACHVTVKGVWQAVPIEVAVTLARGRAKRCEDCDGAVRIHQEGKIAAHAEHLERHAGCPRSDLWPKDGSGVRSRHPNPLD